MRSITIGSNYTSILGREDQRKGCFDGGLPNEDGQCSLEDLEGQCSLEGLLKRDNEEETLHVVGKP
jgi:hypothetical protein